MSRLRRFGPWVIAAAVGFVVVVAWLQFSGSATTTCAQVGDAVLRVFLVTLIVAVLGSMMCGSPRKLTWAPPWLRDGVEMIVTIGVMAVVAVPAISPFVAS